MCELCSNDPTERTAARDSHYAFASALNELADKYRALGSGDIKPHTDKAKVIGIQACAVIRRLVEEWV